MSTNLPVYPRLLNYELIFSSALKETTGKSKKTQATSFNLLLKRNACKNYGNVSLENFTKHKQRILYIV